MTDYDEFNAHEVMHMAAKLQQFFAETVMDATYVAANPRLKAQAEDVHQALHDMYQAIATQRFEEFDDD